MRRLLLLVPVFLLVAIAQPARAQFCPGAAPWVFDDVAASDPFCGFITFAAQNGITLGCAIIDANHRLYCPGDPVRRDQMAAFVNRLANVRVEAVGTGPGLTGGPITGVGTINLATTQLLPTTPCVNGQVAKWNGSAWVCSSDANSGGTVTSVGSGTGLTGGPIAASGALSIAPGFQLPQACANGQVAKSNGSNAWTCASDDNSGGTITSVAAGAGLSGGGSSGAVALSVDTASIQARVSGTCAVGSYITAIAANGTVTCATEAVQQLFAVVDAAGTLARGLRVTSVTKLAGLGNYEVVFDRNVTTCVFMATIGPGGAGSATGQINVAARSGNVNGVFVDTNDIAGASADKPFHLLVNC